MPKMTFDLGNVIMVAIVLVMVAGLGLYGYTTFMVPQSTVDGTTIPTGDIFAGNLDVKTSEVNMLSGGAHTSANAKLYFYTSEPKTEADGVVISSTSKNIEIARSAKGWGWVSIHNEDDGYLIAPWMEDTFKTHNPRIKEVYYKDLDADSKKEMIGKCWFGDMVVASGQDPEWTFQIAWIDEDVASWADDDPADQSSLGTTAGTTFSITTKYTGITAGDGAIIGKLYMVTNDTREGNDLRLEACRLYGDWTIKGKSSWSLPASTSANAYEAYYYMPTEYTDPFNGILVYRDVQAADALYVTLSGKLYLETSNEITVDIYMEIIGGDGANTQLTDSVKLSA